MAASQNGVPSASSLLKPLRPTDVLIADERILYGERKHWAILIRSFVETMTVLVFITLFAGGIPGNAFGGFIIVVAMVSAVGLLWGREFKRAVAYGTVGAAIFGFVVFGQANLAVLAIVVTALRFVQKAAMWAFYDRLYITTRRVIAATGFLGAQINTMPLTRVTDISYKTTVAGELLGYSELRVETAGQDQALGLIKYLDRPASFYDILIDRSTAAVGSVTEDGDEVGDARDEGDPTTEIAF